MGTVWIVVEYDWESAVPLEAWDNEAKAEERAKAIEAEKRAAHPQQSSVWAIGVEDVPFNPEGK